MGNYISEFPCCPIKSDDIFRTIESTKYESNSDQFLIQLETDYNLLQYISFKDYLNELYQFNQDEEILNDEITVDSSNPYSLWEEHICFESFLLFVETRIIQHSALYDYRNEKNQKKLGIFKDFLNEGYINLKKNFAKYSDDKQNIIKKYHLLGFGFLYCKGKIKTKAEVLFKLFKTKSEEFVQSENLSKFLISLFLIPSFCLVFVRMKVGYKYPELGEITKTEGLEILSSFDLVEIERLVMIFYESLLDGKESLSYQEFLLQFVSKNFGWMFKGSGVRNYLEMIKLDDDDEFPEKEGEEDKNLDEVTN